MEPQYESILEIYPIFCSKSTPMITDYRFSCTLPEKDVNKKLELLEPYNEGYVLIDNKHTFIGIQNHIGTKQIRSDVSIADDTLLYYLMYLVAPNPNHIVRTAFEFCKQKDRLHDFQLFAEIVTKTGLKLTYHKKKVGETPFNEYAFVNNTIEKYFSQKKSLRDLFSILQKEILAQQEDLNEFIFYFMRIGIDTAQYAPINILYNVN